MNMTDKGKHIIIGVGYKAMLDDSLRRWNVEPIYLPPNPFVDKRLCWHADLSVFHPGGSDIILAPYLKESEFAQKLCEIGMNCIFADIKQSEKYPDDTQLNACSVGKYLFCSKGISYSGITDLYSHEYRIYVKQGYCGCSICVVDENSIITADRAIASAAADKGIDALLISPGHIKLDGYEYGFIGGTSFRISESCLLFTGKLDAHPDYDSIVDFLEKRNIYAKFLTEYPVFDVGSGIILG